MITLIDGRRLYSSSIGVIKGLGIVDTPPPTEHPGASYQLTVADPVTLKVLDRIKLDEPFRPWAFAPGEKRICAELSNQRAGGDLRPRPAQGRAAPRTPSPARRASRTGCWRRPITGWR
jgi:hypothetical protein